MQLPVPPTAIGPKVMAAAIVCGLAVLLTACASALDDAPVATSALGEMKPAAPVPGQGTSARIGLLLPMAGTGQSAVIAKSMRQAAELALFERNDPSIQLITKDDGGTALGARSAAEATLAEGAEIIVGPLNADAVAGAAAVARPAGRPLLAFSNDRQVAGGGVYLMSFLPEQETRRIVSFAASRGKHRFAALIPDTAYGRVIEPAFRAAVADVGGTIVALERFPVDANQMLAPARHLLDSLRAPAGQAPPVDALFLPAGPESLVHLGPLIAYSGLDTTRVQLLGTGAWDVPSLGNDRIFVGGWYPGTDPRSWSDFSQRFAKTFGSAPPRLASLAYDAVNLAISLAGAPPGQRYAPAAMTRESGFIGVDGLVRFAGTGLPERDLEVLEVQSFGARLVEPGAPTFDQKRLTTSALPAQ